MFTVLLILFSRCSNWWRENRFLHITRQVRSKIWIQVKGVCQILESALLSKYCNKCKKKKKHGSVTSNMIISQCLPWLPALYLAFGVLFWHPAPALRPGLCLVSQQIGRGLRVGSVSPCGPQSYSGLDKAVRVGVHCRGCSRSWPPPTRCQQHSTAVTVGMSQGHDMSSQGGTLTQFPRVRGQSRSGVVSWAACWMRRVLYMVCLILMQQSRATGLPRWCRSHLWWTGRGEPWTMLTDSGKLRHCYHCPARSYSMECMHSPLQSGCKQGDGIFCKSNLWLLSRLGWHGGGGTLKQ